MTVASYWQLPDRLYDDPEELADWAKVALAAAQRAALQKRPRVRKAAKRRPKEEDRPGKVRFAGFSINNLGNFRHAGAPIQALPDGPR